jgi:hypothetical protein
MNPSQLMKNVPLAHIRGAFFMLFQLLIFIGKTICAFPHHFAGQQFISQHVMTSFSPYQIDRGAVGVLAGQAA